MDTASSADEGELLLRRHLQDIAHLPLLSAGEELAAAATMADGREAENQLAALGQDSEINLKFASALTSRIAEGEQARERLVASSRRLVVSLVRQHSSDPSMIPYLLEAGDEALGRAADRYDPIGGLPFSSFVRWWVERALREIDGHPANAPTAEGAPLADPTLLTALGHLHQEDCRVIELRMGLHSVPLSGEQTAHLLGIDPEEEREREERAVAKLRHPCTPGNLTYLRRL